MARSLLPFFFFFSFLVFLLSTSCSKTGVHADAVFSTCDPLTHTLEIHNRLFNEPLVIGRVNSTISNCSISVRNIEADQLLFAAALDNCSVLVVGATLLGLRTGRALQNVTNAGLVGFSPTSSSDAPTMVLRRLHLEDISCEGLDTQKSPVAMRAVKHLSCVAIASTVNITGAEDTVFRNIKMNHGTTGELTKVSAFFLVHVQSGAVLNASASRVVFDRLKCDSSFGYETQAAARNLFVTAVGFAGSARQLTLLDVGLKLSQTQFTASSSVLEVFFTTGAVSVDSGITAERCSVHVENIGHVERIYASIFSLVSSTSAGSGEGLLVRDNVLAAQTVRASAVDVEAGTAWARLEMLNCATDLAVGGNITFEDNRVVVDDVSSTDLLRGAFFRLTRTLVFGQQQQQQQTNEMSLFQFHRNEITIRGCTVGHISRIVGGPVAIEANALSVESNNKEPPISSSSSSSSLTFLFDRCVILLLQPRFILQRLVSSDITTRYYRNNFFVSLLYVSSGANPESTTELDAVSAHGCLVTNSIVNVHGSPSRSSFVVPVSRLCRMLVFLNVVSLHRRSLQLAGDVLLFNVSLQVHNMLSDTMASTTNLVHSSALGVILFRNHGCELSVRRLVIDSSNVSLVNWRASVAAGRGLFAYQYVNVAALLCTLADAAAQPESLELVALSRIRVDVSAVDNVISVFVMFQSVGPDSKWGLRDRPVNVSSCHVEVTNIRSGGCDVYLLILARPSTAALISGSSASLSNFEMPDPAGWTYADWARVIVRALSVPKNGGVRTPLTQVSVADVRVSLDNCTARDFEVQQVKLIWVRLNHSSSSSSSDAPTTPISIVNTSTLSRNLTSAIRYSQIRVALLDISTIDAHDSMLPHRLAAVENSTLFASNIVVEDRILLRVAMVYSWKGVTAAELLFSHNSLEASSVRAFDGEVSVDGLFTAYADAVLTTMLLSDTHITVRNSSSGAESNHVVRLAHAPVSRSSGTFVGSYLLRRASIAVSGSENFKAAAAFAAAADAAIELRSCIIEDVSIHVWKSHLVDPNIVAVSGVASYPSPSSLPSTDSTVVRFSIVRTEIVVQNCADTSVSPESRCIVAMYYPCVELDSGWQQDANGNWYLHVAVVCASTAADYAIDSAAVTVTNTSFKRHPSPTAENAFFFVGLLYTFPIVSLEAGLPPNDDNISILINSSSVRAKNLPLADLTDNRLQIIFRAALVSIELLQSKQTLLSVSDSALRVENVAASNRFEVAALLLSGIVFGRVALRGTTVSVQRTEMHLRAPLSASSPFQVAGSVTFALLALGARTSSETTTTKMISTNGGASSKNKVMVTDCNLLTGSNTVSGDARDAMVPVNQAALLFNITTTAADFGAGFDIKVENVTIVEDGLFSKLEGLPAVALDVALVRFPHQAGLPSSSSSSSSSSGGLSTVNISSSSLSLRTHDKSSSSVIRSVNVSAVDVGAAEASDGDGPLLLLLASIAVQDTSMSIDVSSVAATESIRYLRAGIVSVARPGVDVLDVSQVQFFVSHSASTGSSSSSSSNNNNKMIIMSIIALNLTTPPAVEARARGIDMAVAAAVANSDKKNEQQEPIVSAAAATMSAGHLVALFDPPAGTAAAAATATTVDNGIFSLVVENSSLHTQDPESSALLLWSFPSSSSTELLLLDSTFRGVALLGGALLRTATAAALIGGSLVFEGCSLSPPSRAVVALKLHGGGSSSAIFQRAGASLVFRNNSAPRGQTFLGLVEEKKRTALNWRTQPVDWNWTTVLFDCNSWDRAVERHFVVERRRWNWHMRLNRSGRCGPLSTATRTASKSASETITASGEETRSRGGMTWTSSSTLSAALSPTHSEAATATASANGTRSAELTPTETIHVPRPPYVVPEPLAATSIALSALAAMMPAGGGAAARSLLAGRALVSLQAFRECPRRLREPGALSPLSFDANPTTLTVAGGNDDGDGVDRHASTEHALSTIRGALVGNGLVFLGVVALSVVYLLHNLNKWTPSWPRKHLPPGFKSTSTTTTKGQQQQKSASGQDEGKAVAKPKSASNNSNGAKKKQQHAPVAKSSLSSSSSSKKSKSKQKKTKEENVGVKSSRSSSRSSGSDETTSNKNNAPPPALVPATKFESVANRSSFPGAAITVLVVLASVTAYPTGMLLRLVAAEGPFWAAEQKWAILGAALWLALPAALLAWAVLRRLVPLEAVVAAEVRKTADEEKEKGKMKMKEKGRRRARRRHSADAPEAVVETGDPSISEKVDKFFSYFNDNVSHEWLETGTVRMLSEFCGHYGNTMFPLLDVLLQLGMITTAGAAAACGFPDATCCSVTSVLIAVLSAIHNFLQFFYYGITVCFLCRRDRILCGSGSLLALIGSGLAVYSTNWGSANAVVVVADVNLVLSYLATSAGMLVACCALYSVMKNAVAGAKRLWRHKFGAGGKHYHPPKPVHHRPKHKDKSEGEDDDNGSSVSGRGTRRSHNSNNVRSGSRAAAGKSSSSSRAARFNVQGFQEFLEDDGPGGGPVEWVSPYEIGDGGEEEMKEQQQKQQQPSGGSGSAAVPIPAAAAAAAAAAPSSDYYENVHDADLDISDAKERPLLRNLGASSYSPHMSSHVVHEAEDAEDEYEEEDYDGEDFASEEEEYEEEEFHSDEE